MSEYINRVELVGIVVTPPGIVDCAEPYGRITIEIPNEEWQTRRHLSVFIMDKAVAAARSLDGGEKIRLLGKVDYGRDFEDAHVMRATVSFEQLEILDKD